MEAHRRLEVELRKWTGWGHEDGTVACSSGTAALHLALESLQLPIGSKVIVPDFTMIACARAVAMAGLIPVFVDCDERLCLDVNLLRCGAEHVNVARARGFSAIMAVHIYGRRCNMDAIARYARINDLAVIEDLAEAHGVKPHPDTDAACWSFYRNKIIAGEEGGAVAFRCEKTAALARQLRCLGFTDKHDFNHVPRGHNYRLANCLAEKILKSLELFRVEGPGSITLRDGSLANSAVAARRLQEKAYDRACPSEWRMPARDVVWIYDFRIKGMDEMTQDLVVAELNKERIAARHGFKTMSSQEEFIAAGRPQPNALAASREVIYLPVSESSIREEEARRPFEIVGRVLEGERADG